MHAGEDHMLDAASLKDIPDLIATICDEVVFGINLDGGELLLPRHLGIAALGGKLIGPGSMFGRGRSSSPPSD